MSKLIWNDQTRSQWTCMAEMLVCPSRSDEKTEECAFGKKFQNCTSFSWGFISHYPRRAPHSEYRAQRTLRYQSPGTDKLVQPALVQAPHCSTQRLMQCGYLERKACGNWYQQHHLTNMYHTNCLKAIKTVKLTSTQITGLKSEHLIQHNREMMV